MKLAALALLLLAGCTTASAPPPDCSAAPAQPVWRGIATPYDRERLRGWREAFVSGLERGRGAGHSTALEREGALLDPDAAIDSAAGPAPGLYRCRTIKLGAKSEGLLDYVSYPAFDCRIDAAGDQLRFTKLSGSQRPVGRIFPDSRSRMIFLGTLVLGDEVRPLDYSFDRERDMIGIVERIDDRRWRILFPSPAFESLIDIIELVPAT